MEELLAKEWFVWGIGLLLAFPVGIVALGEFAQRVAGGGWAAYAGPLKFLRTVCLPLLFVMLMLRTVAGYGSEHLAVKIADTAFWIAIINFALAVTNVAFFDDTESASAQARVPKLLLDLLRLFLVLVATAIVVSTVWSVDLGGLLTALGVGSLVIGLALQDTLGSVFSGIAMLSTRQVRVGDFLSVAGEEGTLTNMNWRTVTIRTLLGDDVVLPNSVVAKEKLTLFGGGGGQRMLGAQVVVAYDHPPDQVVRLMEQTAMATANIVMDPAPVARLVGFEDFGVRYALWFTADSVNRVYFARHEFYCNFWYACLRNNIVFPGQYNREVVVPREVRESRIWTNDEIVELVAQSGAVPRPLPVLKALLSSASRRVYRAGSTILKQGEITRDVLIVIAGKAEALYSPEPGRDLAIHEFEHGQLVVFKSLFRTGDCPFTIRASQELTVVAVPAGDFKAFLSTDMALSHDIERAISAREEAAVRALAQSFPGQHDANGAADRVQYLREMFRV